MMDSHRSLVTGHRSLFTVALAGLLAMPGTVGAQQDAAASAPLRSTRAGVYTRSQAARGGELYALNCANCHTPATHTGPVFVAKWDGHPLADLFEYVRSAMPKSDPGSLSRREYTLVITYLLKLNGQPAGPDELPADSLALRKIRMELKATTDTARER